jgi:ABC-type sugar transport system, permease component
MSKRTLRIRPLNILGNLVFMLMSLGCIFPVIWVAYTSFKPLKEYNVSILSLPQSPTLANYDQILRTSKFLNYFANSAFTSLVTLVAVLALAFLTGYFLSRFKFRGRNLLYGFLMLGIVVPTHAWLLPVFIQFKTLGIYDKRITLLFPYIAFALPTAIFLIESFVRTIPVEMEESAMIEGCTVWSALRCIIMPLCLPILATVLILTFNGSWNEFPFAMVLINRDALKTVPVALTMFTGAYTTNYPQLVAALGIAILPVVVVYLAFSKNIMKGMTAGAVKG